MIFIQWYFMCCKRNYSMTSKIVEQPFATGGAIPAAPLAQIQGLWPGLHLYWWRARQQRDQPKGDDGACAADGLPRVPRHWEEIIWHADGTAWHCRCSVYTFDPKALPLLRSWQQWQHLSQGPYQEELLNEFKWHVFGLWSVQEWSTMMDLQNELLQQLQDFAHFVYSAMALPSYMSWYMSFGWV